MHDNTEQRRTPRLHADQIARDFTRAYKGKYMKGQKEHGGKLWEKPGMLNHMTEEILDLVSYVEVLNEQANKASVALEAGDYDQAKYWLDKILDDGDPIMAPDDYEGDGFHGIS